MSTVRPPSRKEARSVTNSVALSPSTDERMRKLAKQFDTTVSTFIASAIEFYMDAIDSDGHKEAS